MNPELVPAEPVIRVRDLVVGFGAKNVLDRLSLELRRGEILGLVGGSGSGKSVLLRTIIGLLSKRSGTIELFGRDTDRASEAELRAINRRWGVLFQQGALFSSLNVKQNIQFPMREQLDLSPQLMEDMATAKLEMVGLAADDALKMPAELSGGMTKRAALARALTLDPEIVLLDEPTSGLDPVSATEMDELIRTLQKTLGLTVFMITHDLESLYSITDRVVVLAEGRVIAEGGVENMQYHTHPWVRAFFGGRRGSLLARRAANN
jgi:phospholipid/cholesterol/gamma-HCH transport system ATP-binding protein